MRAAVLRVQPRQVEVLEVDLDRPAPNEVLVRLAATGLCHSDFHHLDPSSPLTAATVMGHEGAGVVEAVGRDVEYVEVGNHVISSPRGFCGVCEWCRRGRATLCPQTGLRRRPGDTPRVRLAGDGSPLLQQAGLGALAETMLVHENCLVKIDRSVPLDRAALIGCGVITGVGAVIRTAKVAPGESVAVVGCGGIGLNCIQGARIAGAHRIVAVDISAAKLQLARTLGATHVVDASLGDAAEQLRRMLPGSDGVDHAFEALGSKATIEGAFRLLRPGGIATVIGLYDGPIELRAADLLPERAIRGSMLGSIDFRRDVPFLLDLYHRGALRLDELITERFSLDDVAAGFQALADNRVARAVITYDA